MTLSIVNALAQTGQTISPLIPIVAGGLLVAGIIIFVISRVTRRKGSHRAPVAKAAVTSAVETAGLPPIDPGVASSGSALDP